MIECRFICHQNEDTGNFAVIFDSVYGVNLFIWRRCSFERTIGQILLRIDEKFQLLERRENGYPEICVMFPHELCASSCLAPNLVDHGEINIVYCGWNWRQSR